MRGFKSIFVSSKRKIKCFLIQEKYFQTTNAVDTLPLTHHLHWLGGGVARRLVDFGYNSLTVQDITTKLWEPSLASILHLVCENKQISSYFFSYDYFSDVTSRDFGSKSVKCLRVHQRHSF